jgi:alkanesulfonate monooxygenase SsuD/methylene tetrahydromethanopterin reductase-like flavin-dependent oxidoreductase (luciferase family)
VAGGRPAAVRERLRRDAAVWRHVYVAPSQAQALYGTPARVAEQVAELRDAGVHHVLAQMSFGYLGHARIVDSMRRFGLEVMPAFR